MQVVCGRWFEFRDQVPIEVTRLWGLGMYEQTAATDRSAELESAGNDVSEQSSAQALTLVLDRHAEPGQQRDRLRIPTGAPTNPCRRVSRGDRGHRPGVIGDDLGGIGLGYHEYPCMPEALAWRAWRRSQSVCSIERHSKSSRV